MWNTPGDYTKARIKHWTHSPDGSKTWYTLESLKQPQERRVWFSYPGQESNACCQTAMAGTLDYPSAIARVLDDGSTQLYRYDYNALGKPIRAVDPAGRETRYTYAANGIDLTRVVQVTSSGEQTLAEITWNTQHRPLTVRDAAGQVTTYTYNANAFNAYGEGFVKTYGAIFVASVMGKFANPAGAAAGFAAGAYSGS